MASRSRFVLDHKFHWPQKGLNCESLAYKVVVATGRPKLPKSPLASLGKFGCGSSDLSYPTNTSYMISYISLSKTSTILIAYFHRNKLMIKGTLWWLNLSISLSSYENNAVEFTLKHLLLFELCAREICEKFVYKHYSETLQYVKK